MKQRILTKVRRMWEHELVRYMGYLEWEDGKNKNLGSPEHRVKPHCRTPKR